MSERATRMAGSRLDGYVGMSIAGLGFILWIASLLPPMSQWGSRYEFVGAIQFALFSTTVPALIVIGAPWRLLGLASEVGSRATDNSVTTVTGRRPLDRIRVAHGTAGSYGRAVSEVVVFIALVIFWRLSPVVDALVRHPWLTVVESITLVMAGVAMWLDLIESPPFQPGTTRPFRLGMCAAAMWTIWVTAYLGAMSHNPWYRAFPQLANGGLSLSADQQFMAGVLWFFSAAAFIPLVFWNLNQWLKSEEDPDDELYRLVRQERSRGFFGTH